MESQEEEYQCSDCGATVPADAKTCPNCGASIEEISEEETSDEEEFVEIPLSSDPITLATIESLLKNNDIEYFLDNNSLDPVLGFSNIRFSKLLVPKGKIEIVEKVFREYEGKTALSNIINTTGGFETDKRIEPEIIEKEVKSEEIPQKKVGGYLLFFSIFLIFLLPFINLPFNIYYFYKISNFLRWYPSLVSIYKIVIIVSSLIILYGIYVGILIRRVYPKAIIYANRFLNVYLVYSVLTFFTAMAVIPYNEIHSNNIVLGLFKNLFRVTAFSLLIIIHWKVYLKKSERVKDTFTIHLN